jgi:alkanesulfonate monooxygenase SsuD/methylene tetrahydromethanopterin reductase-like flavin-dependent oxidoreductase (luciferase family)
MTIGTNVRLLPMHHPLRVAEDAAVAALVSGGRFILGVGQGYVQHEFEVLGFSQKHRPSLFVEGVEIIRRAWEKGRIGYEGKRWHFEDLPFVLRPELAPPVYIGAFAEPAIDRASRMGDRLLASAGVESSLRHIEGFEKLSPDTDGQAKILRWLPQGWVTCTKIRSELEATWLPPSCTSAAAMRGRAQTGARQSRSRYGPKTYRGRDTSSATQMSSPRASPGSTKEAPYDHFCFWARLPELTHGQALESMRLFASEAAPRVRDAVKA